MIMEKVMTWIFLKSVHSFSETRHSSGCISGFASIGQEKSTEHLSILSYAVRLQLSIKSAALSEGKKLHSEIIREGYGDSTYLQNLIVQMYSSCDCLNWARETFENIRNRNTFSWNIMAAACVKHGRLEEARRVFDATEKKDVVSWTAMVTAYARNNRLNEAKQLFDMMQVRNGVTWMTMVTSYAHFGHIRESKAMYAQMPSWNVESWNAMIMVFGQYAKFQEAKRLFCEMPMRNVVTWTCLILASANNGLLEDAQESFDKMPLRDIVSATSLLSMFAQRGDVKKAKEIFDAMAERSVISWNAMISGYAHNGKGREALNLFKVMEVEGVGQTRASFVCALDACGSAAAAANEGREIHSCIIDERMVDVVVGTALITMYGKSGMVRDARRVFDEEIDGTARNLQCWNAMMGVYAQNGFVQEIVDLFWAVQLYGIQPNEITLMSVLSACSHGGLISYGRRYFMAMMSDYGLTPELDHYLCIVDILVRSGRVFEAQEIIKCMPCQPDAIAWTTLLSGCILQAKMYY